MDEIGCTNLKHWKVSKKKSTGRYIGSTGSRRTGEEGKVKRKKSSPAQGLVRQIFMWHQTGRIFISARLEIWEGEKALSSPFPPIKKNKAV